MASTAFDNLAPAHASIGNASLGKVRVDCRFDSEKAKWGTLGDRNSAGIVYLDLTFNQPNDCRLRSATVQVTLDDDDEHLIQQLPPSNSNLPVQIVKFGPQRITGQPRFEQVSAHSTFIPSVQIGSLGGFGGAGRESTKTRVRECRWTFEGHLIPSARKRRNTWAYKTIQWRISENELVAQSLHNNTIHTAFSFVHDNQPFFMFVEVSGKLESRLSDPRRARCATILVDFKGHHKHIDTPLDGLVRGLDLAMEYDNMTSPVEVEGPQKPAPVPRPPAGQDANNQPPAEGTKSPTEPTIENIASLSAKWLVPPGGHPAPISDPGGHINITGISTETTRQHLGSQRQNGNITVREADIEGLNSTTASLQMVSGQGAGVTPLILHPPNLQGRVPADRQGLGIMIILLIRMWIIRRIAALFGYDTGRSDWPPTVG
ncbi:hypothetical protein F4861DRAFT_530694 [Xylaria intraflava]|nr:hypothetical protein F4861DRAFT_530694 [Xylaria intraflava]